MKLFKKEIKGMFREDMDIRDRLLNLILLATFGGGMLFFLVSILVGAAEELIVAISFLVAAVAIALFISVTLRQPQIAAIVVVMVANMGVFPLMYFMGGGIASGIPVWQVFGLIFSWLLLKGASSIIIYVLNAGVTVLCIVLEMLYPGMVKPLSNSNSVCIAMIQSIFVVTCILGVVFKYQIYVYEKQKSQLELQTKRAEARREKVERLSEQMMVALANTIDAKDKYTSGHSMRVAEYAREIARRAGKSEQEQQEIYYIGLLHDIGKIGVPNRIINKSTGLTEEEYEVMKDHPRIGAEILENMTEIPELKVGAHWHHELYDGTGYPDGLKGEEIPEIARIIGVADAYDAMTSKRSYRDVLSQEAVKKELEKGRGSQFDPQFAEIMLEIMAEDTEYLLRENGERGL